MKNGGQNVWSSNRSNNPKYFILDSKENEIRMRCRLIFDPNGHLNSFTNLKNDKLFDSSSSFDNLMKSTIIKPIKQREQEQEEEEEEEELILSEEEDSIENIEKENELSALKDDIEQEKDWIGISLKTSNKEKYKKEMNEETICVIDCELVKPMNLIKGKFEITTTNIYFFTIKNEKELFNEELNEIKISLNEIIEIYKRRYLLRYTGIEIFLNSKYNYFFNFKKNDIELVINSIFKLNLKNLKMNGLQHKTPSKLLKQSKITEKWVNNEISNFEYLMNLNTIANRTYSDLTQYPIFPWILNDYKSETINLNDESIYRDLSKPIGIVNEKKKQEVKERYESFIDDTIPKFHWGSHYSSVGSVLYYLIRIEPFSNQNITLQGGQFDLPDRLFHSIESTWNNIMLSISDVKELIPEFYYFPDFLKNINNINLGVKQNNEIVSDVILPKWANGSSENFIRINRDALESDYVSQHLNEWIDLIFGYKQKGPEAVKSFNIFYYLTYEGMIDIDEIKDPILKASFETQISNFGQTPSQLFFKPHPKKKKLKIYQSPSYWNRSYDINPFFTNQILDINQPIIFIHFENDRQYILNMNREVYIYNYLKLKPTSIINISLGIPYASDAIINSSCFGISGEKYLFSCGHFDKSIKISNLQDKLKILNSIFDHKDIVTCLKLSKKSKILLSGSKDCTIKIWNINLSTKNTNEILSLFLTLYGHESPIISLDLNEDLDVVVSGSINGICMIHDLRNGNLIRKIIHPNKKQLNIVKISNDGHILIHSFEDRFLYLYSINGELIYKENTNDILHSIEFLENSKYFIQGGNNRLLSIKRVYDFKNIHSFQKTSNSIKCLEFKSKNEIIIGLSNGILNCYQIENELFENVHVHEKFQIINEDEYKL